MATLLTRRTRIRPKILLPLVLGLGLLVEQVVFFHGGANSSPVRSSAPAGIPGNPGTPYHQVATVVNQALGPSDRGVNRFHIDSLAADPAHRGKRVLTLTWAVNGDLTMGSVSAGAQVETFLLLRSLYTSHLPLSDVRITGTFGNHDRAGRAVEVPVLRLELAARTIPAEVWSSLDDTTLWPLIHRLYVRPGFECNCQE
ncbi:MAG TPA: hypothetical protein VIJ28_09445 [Chloroflexota bacterium]